MERLSSNDTICGWIKLHLRVYQLVPVKKTVKNLKIPEFRLLSEIVEMKRKKLLQWNLAVDGACSLRSLQMAFRDPLRRKMTDSVMKSIFSLSYGSAIFCKSVVVGSYDGTERPFKEGQVKKRQECFRYVPPCSPSPLRISQNAFAKALDSCLYIIQVGLPYQASRRPTELSSLLEANEDKHIYIYCTTSLTAYRNWLSCVLQTMQRPLILSESWSRSNTCILIAQVPLAFVGVADVNVFFFLPCSFFV